MPIRIQRKRTRGWKMPPNTVYVGRPTKWGNPYEVGRSYHDQETGETWEHISQNTAVEFYKEAILNQYPAATVTIEEIVKELKGKNLACWCSKDERCHADVLLRLANTACTGLATPSAKLSGSAQPANQ